MAVAQVPFALVEALRLDQHHGEVNWLAP